MCEAFVFKWWDALDAGSLKDCYDWSQASPQPFFAIATLVLIDVVTMSLRFIG
jgi:hypothetical protein